MRISPLAGVTLAGLAAALLPAVAVAQPVTGLYVGAGAGGNFMQPEKLEEIYHALPAHGFPGASGSFRIKEHFDTGAVGLGSIGYGFGNGLRLEVEGDYRYNQLKHYPSSYGEQKFGAMGNALFDFDIGSPYVFPYVGAGAGYMREDRSLAIKPETGSFAYQGIAGLAFPIPFVVGLSATLEYRFMNVAGNSQKYTALPVSYGVDKTYNDLNHSAMLGLRYAFNVAPPVLPPASAPSAAAPPTATPARSYLVFFDWDRADLTARARQIVAEAAAASTRVQTTRIEVQGNADRTGTAAYNLALSRRRAEAVAAELVTRGVPRGEIQIQAFGDTKPLVPTAAGVREPQNRRVEIILH
jgi:outer membrane protein OmpA-like peptidoglycan-associated protein